uniref:Uncharacterized protein n=1 Tax=Timema shepardi TaxID=629360 RepID=A0A7R9ANX9_TIMSH|nr:unnamed protein product [Timema shepardi]
MGRREADLPLTLLVKYLHLCSASSFDLTTQPDVDHRVSKHCTALDSYGSVRLLYKIGGGRGRSSQWIQGPRLALHLAFHRGGGPGLKSIPLHQWGFYHIFAAPHYVVTGGMRGAETDRLWTMESVNPTVGVGGPTSAKPKSSVIGRQARLDAANLPLGQEDVPPLSLIPPVETRAPTLDKQSTPLLSLIKPSG